MRRIDRKTVGLLFGVASAMLAGVAAAGPSINSAVIMERVFNDCPGSTLVTANAYPASIRIADTNAGCIGFANLHIWRLSEDGASAALFGNGDGFSLSARLVISGDGECEAGLGINPWWTFVDGRVNVRTTDGEIACFGGRMPFYSFTAPPHNLHYVKGTPIDIEIIYLPNGLSMASPGTIQYNIGYGGMNYSSGVLPFDEGNPDEDPPYGLWGILNNASAGGHQQFFLGQSPPTGNSTALWTDIEFTSLAVGIRSESWTGIKGLYR